MPVTPTSPSQTPTSLEFDAPAETGGTGPWTYQWFLVDGAADFTPAPVVVTPHGEGVTFDPPSLTFGAGDPPPAQSIVPTPSAEGDVAISVTNDGGLTNPAAWTLTVEAIPGRCRLVVRVRNGSGELVSGCTVTAELVEPGIELPDSVVTLQPLTAVTGDPDQNWPAGYAELKLFPESHLLPETADRRYRVRVKDPQGVLACEKLLAIPDTDEADFWEL